MKKFLFGVLVGILCVAGYMVYQGRQTKEQTTDGTIVLEIEASPDATADVSQGDGGDDSMTESGSDESVDAPSTDTQQDAATDSPAVDLPQNTDEIQELAKQLEVELSPEDAQKLLDTIEKLEALGVSPDVVKEKAAELYEKYGKDCVEHVQEAVTDAVKSAAENAAEKFADDVKQSVSDAVGGIFEKVSGGTGEQ